MTVLPLRARAMARRLAEACTHVFAHVHAHVYAHVHTWMGFDGTSMAKPVYRSTIQASAKQAFRA